MKNKIWYLFFLVVITVPLLAFAAMRWYDDHLAALPYYRQGKATESAGATHFIVPGLAFINQDGKVLSGGFVNGKVWVINYFFTSCPTICPKMMTGLKLLQEAFPKDKDVRMISLTVDPYHDDPAKLKRYAISKKIDVQQWQLGTGSKKELYGFARHALFITADDGDGGAGDFIHSEKIVLVDQKNHIRGYYNGTDAAEIDQLIRDITKLKAAKD